MNPVWLLWIGLRIISLLCSDIGPLRRIFERLPSQLYHLPCLPKIQHKIQQKKSTSSPLMIQRDTTVLQFHIP
ncbi:hypothetical protein KC19_VG029300 [Ceratodon purpureus]|uniref:Secreted protein n=1 Tax=Ceratodon purpureus TaxID=3225 RepID=A0A8T0HLH1_CERPU|nr:hypothetical protein KC19_VG029300 [Ceratodon purpureus]